MESTELSWDQLRHEFTDPTQPWCLMVGAIELALWQRYYHFLRGSEAQLSLEVDGEAAELPEKLTLDLFAPYQQTRLTIGLADLQLTTELLTPAEMVIAIPPGTIDSEAHFRIILRILTTLGRRLRRPALLYHCINGRVMLRYVQGEGINQATLTA